MDGLDAAEECHAYFTDVMLRTATYRKEMNQTRYIVLRLHEHEAELERELLWMRKVVSAYIFTGELLRGKERSEAVSQVIKVSRITMARLG